MRTPADPAAGVALGVARGQNEAQSDLRDVGIAVTGVPLVGVVVFGVALFGAAELFGVASVESTRVTMLIRSWRNCVSCAW